MDVRTVYIILPLLSQQGNEVELPISTKHVNTPYSTNHKTASQDILQSPDISLSFPLANVDMHRVIVHRARH